MEKIIQFLNENNIGILATSTDNRPYIRLQHIHLIKDGKFYFTTANVKRAYKQLKDNPYIEFMATDDKYVTGKISGEIKFTDDINVKQMVMDNSPSVKKGYKNADNPIYEVFYLEHGEAVFSDLLSGKESEVFNF
ncbi:pyridoxamine 5'-phosphate oxidase family protein [Clostridium gasigenes]|uniref:pyridoxamine 5'-phosphate oxidase family protein n=1 Tax=Clostridium gasigenes TaxID=94869 RepID=UPI0014384420|nr:pyridoxamine 5'-phosphate oxidase family protein [Clostridium gasigenes]NKF05658.1 pyridoxamine 5'-phosphate oxidase [Clostridium gasigenes]QSW19096.1 pyridoxamine 5'-phosphate oxidase family protein [Clostridium gasigenes]